MPVRYFPTRFPYYQSHPFTIVAFPRSLSSPNQQPDGSKTDEHATSQVQRTLTDNIDYRFIIVPQTGLTKSLYQFVMNSCYSGSLSSCQRLPVFMEGPYVEGVPGIHYNQCQDMLFLVGGSGISVAISSLYRALAVSEIRSVSLVWSVKSRKTIQSVAREELEYALADSRFSLKG